MAKYQIQFIEYTYHFFDYEADSKEEAKQKFMEDCNEGTVDFSGGETYESEIHVEEVK